MTGTAGTAINSDAQMKNDAQMTAEEIMGITLDSSRFPQFH